MNKISTRFDFCPVTTFLACFDIKLNSKFNDKNSNFNSKHISINSNYSNFISLNLILTGKSEKPVYLNIHNDKVEILPADEIWGQTVWYADEWIRKKHQDPQVKIAAIGVSGENMVRYACVVNDLHRAAGRSGVGAVMGSKNLKAICTRGTVGVQTEMQSNSWMLSSKRTMSFMIVVTDVD